MSTNDRVSGWLAEAAAAQARLRDRWSRPYRVVRSPLTEDMLRPLEDGCGGITVTFDQSWLTDDELARVARLLADSPDAGLRVTGKSYRSVGNLDFLQHFPTIPSFSAAMVTELKDVDGLCHLPENLQRLALGGAKRTLPLAGLTRFRHLRSLSLEGHFSGIEAVSQLGELRTVTLRSVTLPDLAILRPLHELRVLQLVLGGTRNLDGLEALQRLRYLEIWQIRGFDDLRPITQVPSLEALNVGAVRNVVELPHLAGMTNLKRIRLEMLKGLHDLAPLAGAPTLEDLALVDMSHLHPENLSVLVGHPTLKRAHLRLGSKRKSEAAAELLQLPDSIYFSDLNHVEELAADQA